MKGEERRNFILYQLTNTKNPISATTLAKECHVSRQVIVGDIALLRALGNAIISTPKGYLLVENNNYLTKQIIVKHDFDKTENELTILVNNNIIVKDVIVNHPVYGIINGQLNIKTLDDIKSFLEKGSTPLSKLTNGIHIHTLLYKDEADFNKAYLELFKIGIIYED